jgi:hypothetical protein
MLFRVGEILHRAGGVNQSFRRHGARHRDCMTARLGGAASPVNLLGRTAQ